MAETIESLAAGLGKALDERFVALARATDQVLNEVDAKLAGALKELRQMVDTHLETPVVFPPPEPPPEPPPPEPPPDDSAAWEARVPRFAYYPSTLPPGDSSASIMAAFADGVDEVWSPLYSHTRALIEALVKHNPSLRYRRWVNAQLNKRPDENSEGLGRADIVLLAEDSTPLTMFGYENVFTTGISDIRSKTVRALKAQTLGQLMGGMMDEPLWGEALVGAHVDNASLHPLSGYRLWDKQPRLNDRVMMTTDAHFDGGIGDWEYEWDMAMGLLAQQLSAVANPGFNLSFNIGHHFTPREDHNWFRDNEPETWATKWVNTTPPESIILCEHFPQTTSGYALVHSLKILQSFQRRLACVRAVRRSEWTGSQLSYLWALFAVIRKPGDMFCLSPRVASDSEGFSRVEALNEYLKLVRPEGLATLGKRLSTTWPAVGSDNRLIVAEFQHGAITIDTKARTARWDFA